MALGWPLERIVVIDADLGHSGAQATGRAGFQQLVADVGMGEAGIVMGLEVSRLARNSADWHRLLEICALTDTLILDEDGLYDPSHFNDRLLLGLKGTMSEAELHVLRARLRGGVLNKARRGELWIHPPVGLIYDPHGQLILDPDTQVQGALRLLFETFRRTGSACATVKAFRQQGLQFPCRLRTRPHSGELLWAPLEHSRVLQVLHNPRYAGAFVFGRTRTRPRVDGSSASTRLSPEEWGVVIPEVHVGYLTWSEYLTNQQRLRDNVLNFGGDHRHGPPREGSALLQGLVLCGCCGRRMTVRYHHYKCGLMPDYVCGRDRIEKSAPLCQCIAGRAIDQAIGQVLIEQLSPLSLQMALAVQEELRTRLEEADRLRQQQVERARYEAELARRRYMQVDPDNRLVADTLEAEWNQKLRQLGQAQEEYQAQKEKHPEELSPQQQAEVQALVQDFPRLWAAPETPQRERKRMIRLLLEDVTLRAEKDHVLVHLRFKGGTASTLQVARRKYTPYRHTAPEVMARIDALLEAHTDSDIATILNDEGYQSGEGQCFTAPLIQSLRSAYHLRSYAQRLRDRGLLTASQMARLLGITVPTVLSWRACGLLCGYRVNNKNQYLYEAPGPDRPTKQGGQPLATRVAAATT